MNFKNNPNLLKKNLGKIAFIIINIKNVALPFIIIISLCNFYLEIKIFNIISKNEKKNYQKFVNFPKNSDLAKKKLKK